MISIVWLFLSRVIEIDWVIMNVLFSSVMTIEVRFYWATLLRFIDKKNIKSHKQFYQKESDFSFRSCPSGVLYEILKYCYHKLIITLSPFHEMTYLGIRHNTGFQWILSGDLKTHLAILKSQLAKVTYTVGDNKSRWRY